jgi:hypothetical protein
MSCNQITGKISVNSSQKHNLKIRREFTENRKFWQNTEKISIFLLPDKIVPLSDLFTTIFAICNYQLNLPPVSLSRCRSRNGTRVHRMRLLCQLFGDLGQRNRKTERTSSQSTHLSGWTFLPQFQRYQLNFTPVQYSDHLITELVF